MTILVTARQWTLRALAQLGIANIGAGNGVNFPINPNDVLESLDIDVTTAFNSGTTATLTVSDGTTTFANAVDITTTGRKTVSGLGKVYTSSATLSVTLAQTGTAATTGAAVVSPSFANT